MPNWCGNELRVRGPEEKVKEFDQKFKGRRAKWGPQLFELGNKTEEEKAEVKARWEQEYNEQKPDYCLNALFPVPQEIIDIGYSVDTKKLGIEELLDWPNRFKDGYLWCIQNWGVKWDITIDYPEDPSGDMIYKFETAWGPPRPWVQKVSKDFPDLFFSIVFVEEGVYFAGLYEYENGVETCHDNYSLGSDAVGYREFVKATFGYDPID